MESLFKAPKAPATLVKEPAPMPTTTDEDVRKAKLRALQGMSQRGGRASTLLSSDKLGG